jgi:seryl-tRNA synthetase
VIAPKKKAKEPCDVEVAQLKEMQSQIDEMKKNVPELAKERNDLLNRIGNVVDPQVPISKDEEHDNLVINLYPEPPEATTSRGDDDEGEHSFPGAPWEH